MIIPNINGVNFYKAKILQMTGHYARPQNPALYILACILFIYIPCLHFQQIKMGVKRGQEQGGGCYKSKVKNLKYL